MIIEKRNGNVAIWNSKCSKTVLSPMLHKVFFNKHTNELELCDNKLFCSHYSIEELDSMLKYLIKINKERIFK